MSQRWRQTNIIFGSPCVDEEPYGLSCYCTWAAGMHLQIACFSFGQVVLWSKGFGLGYRLVTVTCLLLTLGGIVNSLIVLLVCSAATCPRVIFLTKRAFFSATYLSRLVIGQIVIFLTVFGIIYRERISIIAHLSFCARAMADGKFFGWAGKTLSLRDFLTSKTNVCRASFLYFSFRMCFVLLRVYN